MALTQQRRDAADGALATLVSNLAALQVVVRNATGRYRQIRRGVSWGTWEDQKPDIAVVEVWADQYRTYDGVVGYVFRAEVRVNGAEVYQRSLNVGPESYRTSGAWLQLVDPE